MNELSELRDQYATNEDYFKSYERMEDDSRKESIDFPTEFNGPIRKGTKPFADLRKLQGRAEKANRTQAVKWLAGIKKLDASGPPYQERMKIRDEIHAQIITLLSNDQKFVTRDDLMQALGGKDALANLESSSSWNTEVNVHIQFEESSPGQRDPNIICDLDKLMPITAAWDDETLQKFLSSSAYNINLYGGRGGHGGDSFYETVTPSMFFYYLRNHFRSHITEDLYRRAETVRRKTFGRVSTEAA